MKKRREEISSTSQTLPASPSHSFSNSSSSEFEFTVSHSPLAATSSTLCPADDLFYKGLLLPLHPSPRLSMVRTLLSASSATASRDSTGSSSTNDSHSSFSLVADCDSSRPSSVNEDDEFKSLNNGNDNLRLYQHVQTKKNKYFSLSRFSSVFKKENNNNKMTTVSSSSSSVKKMSTTAKEVIRKYLKKVKPLYDKVGGFYSVKPDHRSEKIINASKESNCHGGISHSFSGNLRYPRRRSCVSSCPSSMRSSPTHSGLLSQNGFQAMGMNTGRVGPGGGGNIGMYYSDISSMEELQSAIQGAIAHCKKSLLQNKTTVPSNEI